MLCVVKTKLADEEPVVFDTGYLHSWGGRVTGQNIRLDYTNSRGSRVHFPAALLAARYGDVELLQFVSTLAVNPYTWGFGDGRLVTSELVRVAFAFVNGTYLALSGLRPADNIELQLTHGTPGADRDWTDRTALPLDNISAVELHNVIELRPTESKFTALNMSALRSSLDGVALTAEVRAYGASRKPPSNSSFASLDVYVGYAEVAHRYQYDSFETYALTWNATSRRYELFCYVFLPFR